MKRVSVASWVVVPVCLLGLLIACERAPLPGQTPPAVERITSFEKVAGQWEGRPQQVRMPDRREAGQIALIIKENGDYRFEDENSSDAGLGSGRFAIQDGKLVSDAGDRITTVILHARDNVHFLGVDVTFRGGDRYTLDMRRVPPGVSPILKSPM